MTLKLMAVRANHGKKRRTGHHRNARDVIGLGTRLLAISTALERAAQGLWEHRVQRSELLSRVEVISVFIVTSNCKHISLVFAIEYQ
jgi:hypothetical protein